MAKENERYVLALCDEALGLTGDQQRTFDWLLGDLSEKTGKRKPLPVDAFYPTLDLVVEFHEKQHTEAVAHFDKPDVLTVSGVHRGIQRRLYDERRQELVPAHGLSLAIHVRVQGEKWPHRAEPRSRSRCSPSSVGDLHPDLADSSAISLSKAHEHAVDGKPSDRVTPTD